MPRNEHDILDLLALAARPRLPGPAADRLRLCASHITDWSEILRAISHHRLAPLIYRNLHRSAPDICPAAVMHELHTSALHFTRTNLFLLQKLLWVLDLFAKHDIVAIPFKGPTLALSAYGDLALRPCSDLDLLLRPEDLVRAKRVLVAQDFVPVFPTSSARQSQYLAALSGAAELDYLQWQREYHLVRTHDGLNLDLHCGIVPESFAFGLERDDLMRDARPEKLAGRSIPQLSPESMLLVLCANGTKDHWSEMDRVVDIAAVIERYPSLDWLALLDRSHGLGIGRALLLAIELARPLLNDPLPDRVAHAIQNDRAIHSLVAHVRARWMTFDARRAGAGSMLFHLRVREHWRDRFRYCTRQLVPTVGDRALAPLPSSLSFLHYVLRPLRLASKFAMGS
jgi:hypothetical protein